MTERVTDPSVVNSATSIKSDPELGPAERESIFRLSRDSDRVVVHSEVRSISRALLTRDDFEMEWVRMSDDHDEIYAVHGTVSVGALKLLSNTRSTDSLSRVVSKHGAADEWSVSESEPASAD